MQKCLGSTITDHVGRKSFKSIFPIILFFQPNSFPLHCVQVVKTMSSFCLSFSLISVSSSHLFIKIFTLYTSIQFLLTSPKYTVQAYRALVTLLFIVLSFVTGLVPHSLLGINQLVHCPGVLCTSPAHPHSPFWLTHPLKKRRNIFPNLVKSNKCFIRLIVLRFYGKHGRKCYKD